MLETEIKLSPVTETQAAALLADAGTAPFLSPETQIRMETVYYDDAPGNLAAQHMTLRLRRENGRGVCTFKAPAAAAFSRLELEAEAETIESGIAALLAAGRLPFSAAALLSRMQVFPTCGARFLRRSRRFSRDGFSCVLSYDIGRVFAGEHSAPLAELEAELEQGTPQELTGWFLPLAAQYGLSVCSVSKHARALALRAEP